MHERFVYEDVIQFAKEYIKSNNIPMEKVLPQGIRISNPVNNDERFAGVRSIEIAGPAFYAQGKSVCSDLLSFEWQKGICDLRIYSPDYSEFPDCRLFMYTEEYVKGYLTREEWLETPYKYISLPDEVILKRLYMDNNTLVSSECMLNDCRTQIVEPGSGIANFLSDLMRFVKNPIKEAVILNTSKTNLRMHRCNDGEYVIVLGG